MFVTTRIANGIVALLALLISIMLLFGGGLAMRMVSIQLALVPLFFSGDLIWRKKNSSGDMIFAVLWTVFFSYALFICGRMLLMDNPPQELGGNFFNITAVVMYGIPFFLNSIYLVRLLKQKKNPA
jgi:hypothetical protein